MKLHIFNRTNKKSKEEKGHREPIMVRIFKDDKNNYGTTVTFTTDDDTAMTEAASADEGESHKKIHFVPNQKYFTISIYVLSVLFAGLLLGVIIFHLTPVLTWLKGLLGVLSPFIAGAILAFIVSPIINAMDEGFFEKVCKMRSSKARLVLSLIITYILLIGLLILAVIVLVPQVGNSASDLLSKSKFLYDSVYSFIATLSERFPNFDFSFLTEKLSDVVPDIITSVTSWLSSSIPKLLNTSYTIVKSVINFLLTIAISIYMVCDKRRIAQGTTKLVYAIMKPSKAAAFIKTSRECGQIFFGFIIGKAIDSLIIGVLCFIVVSIFGLPYAVLISVIVGITNMIPFFGPFIGAIPGVIIYLCIEPIYALVFIIIILIIQQLDGWFIGPMILGDSTGIRPIWVIFGITIGGAYFGVLGMFLGVPFTAVIVYLINKSIEKKLKKKNIEIS